MSAACKKEEDRESSEAQMPPDPTLSERNQKSLERKEFSGLGMELCQCQIHSFVPVMGKGQIEKQDTWTGEGAGLTHLYCEEQDLD